MTKTFLMEVKSGIAYSINTGSVTCIKANNRTQALTKFNTETGNKCNFEDLKIQVLAKHD